MPESWKTRLARWKFNWFPAYRATGARITYIASDWCEVRIRLPLSRRTRNYVGTIFGGSMYAALDPIYMIMLIHTLGPAYEVWDKSASIRFIRPGRETLYATFRLTPGEIVALRGEVDEKGRAEPEFMVDLSSATGEKRATCRKVLSIRSRSTRSAVAEPSGSG